MFAILHRVVSAADCVNMGLNMTGVEHDCVSNTRYKWGPDKTGSPSIQDWTVP